MKFPWYIWVPRIFIIVVALFMAMFSLDVFDMKANIWHKLLGSLMHNIPSLILLLILLVTWNRPLWAGIIFLIAGFGLSIAFLVFFKRYFDIDFLLFAFPTLMCSILFFLVNLKSVKI